RRIEEGKILHRAELEAGGAQDDGGERGAQELRIREGRTLREVLLGVQAHADAARHPPAAAGALARRRLRDRLDLKHLDLVAVAVALDARRPRVDDEADAR